METAAILTSENQTIQDIDGNIYPYATFKIGENEYIDVMLENYRCTHYRDGSPIPLIEDGKKWAKDTAGAMCYYDNDIANAKEHGALYNNYATCNPLFAPEGWEAATEDTWKEIEIALGMSQEDADDTGWRGEGIGTKMKDMLNMGMGGFRDCNGGTFYNLGYQGYWWSSTPYSIYAWSRGLDYSMPSVCRTNGNRSYGFSVRCVRKHNSRKDRLFTYSSISEFPEEITLKAFSSDDMIRELKERGFKGNLRIELK